MRTAFGEMDDAFHGILAGDVLATARRLAAVARAAERAGGAGLGRGDVGSRREGRALRMATAMTSTSTVHTSVMARATQPLPMDAPTVLNDPAARLPDRLSYTFTNTGRITATVKARITDMTHSRAAG